MEDTAEFEMLRIKSHKGEYEVHFDEDSLETLNSEVSSQMHFIIDEKVARLYGEVIPAVLNSPSVLTIEASESAKSLEQFPAYVEHLVRCGVRRGDQLVAIGGGVIQDIVCFLASTLLRGLDWQFYPTTLLAQADSCIGSKSSINVGATKNILGTFTPPKRIRITTRVLETLSENEIRSGIGEMLKVHVIDGPESFNQIAAAYTELLNDREVLFRYIARSLEIKKGFVELDEFDQGPRNVMNYGHSFGHAIESATEFGIPHGIAITIGADMANYAAVGLGVTNQEHFDRMHPTLARNYEPYRDYPIPLEPFLKAISKDKKNKGDQLSLILPDEKGRVGKDLYPNDDQFHAICSDYFESRGK